MLPVIPAQSRRNQGLVGTTASLCNGRLVGHYGTFAVASPSRGLPVAAGTYLVSKVFEDQVNQLSSGVYSVSGSLEEPEVVFERVFDAKTRMSPTGTQGSSDAESASSVK